MKKLLLIWAAWQARRKAAWNAEKDRGYRFGKHWIEGATIGVDVLEGHACDSPDPFDRGVMDAIEEHKQKGRRI